MYLCIPKLRIHILIMRNRLLFLLLVVFSTATNVMGQIIINELMQSNVDLIRDDVKEYPDSWVELYNSGSQPVSLGNYQIGIKIDGSKKPVNAWRLPNNVTISPYGYQLIYCDKGYDDLLADLTLKKKLNSNPSQQVVTDAEKESLRLHTNFRLESGKGCVVYLFKNGNLQESASVVDSLKKQPAPNIAYGRVSNGASTWGYELNPTPGYANGGGVCAIDHILGEPKFSVPGKVMASGSSFQLTLSLPKNCPSGTVIRYTDTGAEPTKNNSTIYSSPITINGSKVIRAKLFCDGWLSPRSTTHSYIFLNRQMTMPVVCISTPVSSLDDPSLGIFANNNSDIKAYQNNWRRPINIEYFESEGTKSIINQLCETRVAGGNSRQFPKKSMNIYAHKRFGKKQFEHEFFPDQKPGLKKFKSLVLRNGGNDFEYLYLRDALAQRVMGMNTDIDWSAWKPVIVYINGEYHGLLNLRERAEEDNIYTNYDGLEDIDLFENWGNLKEGDDVELKKFKAFYNQSGHTMDQYEKWMDCREFTNMMIMNMYNINLDFPGGNIVMWRPRAADGRWRWIAKDVDYSFGYGGAGHISPNYNIVDWYYNPNYDNVYNWANGETHTLLFRNLMADESFRNQFMELYAIYAGDFLNKTAVRNVLDPMYNKIKNELTIMRNSVSYMFANLDNEKNFVNDWIANRTDAFMQQLCTKYKAYGFNIDMLTPLSINTLETSNLDTLMFNGHKLSKNNFNNKYFRNHPIRLSAIPVEGKIVRGWRVVQTNGASSTTTDYNTGASLTINAMPSCTKLSIEPILRLVGDYNDNNVIDSSDIETMASVILKGNFAEEEIELYDLTGDKTVNAADLVKLINLKNIAN